MSHRSWNSAPNLPRSRGPLAVTRHSFRVASFVTRKPAHHQDERRSCLIPFTQLCQSRLLHACKLAGGDSSNEFQSGCRVLRRSALGQLSRGVQRGFQLVQEQAKMPSADCPIDSDLRL